MHYALLSILFFLRSRWKLVVFLNLLFFGFAFGSALVATLLSSPALYSGSPVFSLPRSVSGNWLLMPLFILAVDAVITAFITMTLPGFVFFPLSPVALAYRAVLWGLLLFPLPVWLFLVILPTTIFEGEAYVLAATAGMVTGFFWIKPVKGVSRRESFYRALAECAHVYVVVVLLLLAAAITETATILLLKV